MTRTPQGEQTGRGTAGAAVQVRHRGQLTLFPVDEPPMETDVARGVYFWATGSGATLASHSSHPHPRLPYYCPIHRNWSDRPCAADHSPAGVARLLELRALPVQRSGHAQNQQRGA